MYLHKVLNIFFNLAAFNPGKNIKYANIMKCSLNMKLVKCLSLCF